MSPTSSLPQNLSLHTCPMAIRYAPCTPVRWTCQASHPRHAFSHHPRLGVTLPHQCSNTMQRGVRCTLHKNRVHHHTLGPHNYVWEQMHAYRPVDDTTARRHSAINHKYPTTVHHSHGRQRCCYLLGGRSCALHPPSAMLTHDPIAPERPCTKFRTRNHPRPHSPPYLTPPTTINGN